MSLAVHQPLRGLELSDPQSRGLSRSIFILIAMMVASTAFLLMCSSLRHYVLRSGAFDLGFFDQAVFLISQGQTPISSLRDFHVLADHASLILYPLAILYWIWADPHMLLAAQAAGLAAGAWPVWKLAQHAGLSSKQSLAVAAAYLMYPLVLTSNLFDFHPDVFFVPAALMAVLAAREGRRFSFCAWIIVALLCKEVLALTVAAMGLWLLIFERRRFFGTFALVAGMVWFIIALKVIIPYFGDGRNPSGMNYYSYLGNSLGEILASFVLRPHLWLAKVLSKDALKYVIIVAVPVLWGLHYRTLIPLVAAVPCVLLNILSEIPAQRSPFYQYSLPVVPFIFISIIAALATRRAWLERPRAIVVWSVALLVVGGVARAGKMQAGQATDWNTIQHTKAALARISEGGRVLTTFETVPQVSRRSVVQYIGGVVPLGRLDDYDYVLISLDHSSLDEHDRQVARVLKAVTVSPSFHAEYVSEDVYLFRRISGTVAFMPTAPIE